ncbi:CP4F3 hydroxylase, partial [Crocuta crocuta]
MPQLSLSWLGLGQAAVSPGLLLLLVGASWLLARVLAWSYSFYETCCRLRCFPQPPKRNWFWGHLGLVSSNEEGLRLMADLGHHFHDVHLWWMGPFYPFLRFVHPKFVAPLLQAPASIMPKDKFIYSFLKPWLGDGLLLSAGDKWSSHRHLLTPAFHFKILKHYVKIFNKSADIMHVSLNPGSQLEPWEKGSGLEKPQEKCEHRRDKSGIRIKNICKLEEMRWSLGYLGYLGPRAEGWRRAIGLNTWEVVPSASRLCLVQQFCEVDKCFCASEFQTLKALGKNSNGVKYFTMDILSLCLFFWLNTFFTSHKPLSYASTPIPSPPLMISCVLPRIHLCRHLSVHSVSQDDLAQLPFLTMCIKESLRLHPPVTVVSRCCAQDITLPDGRVIPKGVICLVSIFGTHHNPSVWPDPEVYNPLRFDPENTKDRSSLAFIPFSAGPR